MKVCILSEIKVLESPSRGDREGFPLEIICNRRNQDHRVWGDIVIILFQYGRYLIALAEAIARHGAQVSDTVRC